MKKKKVKLEDIIFTAGITGFVICIVTGVVVVLSKIIEVLRNAIGYLYLDENGKVSNYLYALFQKVSKENVEASKAAFEKNGYTEYGMYNILSQSDVVFYIVIIFVLAIIMFFLVLWSIRRKKIRQKEEQEQLLNQIEAFEEIAAKDKYTEKQNKRTQNFIENVSHQIKTPISRIYSSLYLVEEEIENEISKERIKECYMHLETVDKLMKRLMNIGRLEAGKVIFNKSKIDFAELIEDTINCCTENKGNVDITFELDRTIEYYGDYQWIKEGLINIISNALEHDKTGIPLQLKCENDNDYIRISIRDHGSGINKKDIPNIFDRFYVPEETKANHIGIGLNLAKLIFQGHRGDTYVYNHTEGGAVFNIILPRYALKPGKYNNE